MVRPRLAIVPPVLSGEPLLPMTRQVFVDDKGGAWVPHAFDPQRMRYGELANGVALGWAPVPESDMVLVSMFAGNPTEPTEDAITIVLTRDGLREVIANLRSIDDQLGDPA